MSLKHIIKYMAVPVVAAFALVGCSHEDFTTAPKSSAEQTEKTTKKRTIKIRLSADIELPKGTGGRGIGFNLDPSSDRYRPYIKWDEIKDKIQTRLYFRKMVKNEDGEMVPSTDRHDIFSVVIKPDAWDIKDVVDGHLKLSTDIVDPKAAKQRVMEIEVPDDTKIDETHPFLPSSEFPKNTPPEAAPGTVVPETKGEWQVAAILSVNLNGDLAKEEEGEIGYDLATIGGYFPQQLIMQKLGTEGAYANHDVEFEATDDEVKPFRYDGYWMLYPKTMYFDHNNPNPQKPANPDPEKEKDLRQAMEIPFCADWKDVEVDERGVVGVELQAKSPGMILHYELIPDDVDAKPDPTPIASARGLSLASRRAKQSFRSGGGSVVELMKLSQDALDNLKSTACTFYGALWYDQVGDKVHWSRGQLDLTEYEDSSLNTKNFMKENTLSVYVRSANVSQKALEQGAHCHILYFVMPPYDGAKAPAGATTAFWLQPRDQDKPRSDYANDNDFSADQPSDYSYLNLSYQLKKKGGQFENQYISTTKLSPGKIHWVRLQYKKLDTPIPFDPDAQP